jgi:hypothetical protein
VNNYLSFLTEGKTPQEYYHASPTQGLKYLDPKKTKSTHLKTNKPYVYVTDEIEYAAGFCFDWGNNEGFRFGDFGTTEKPLWRLSIPRKYVSRLKAPCSMYIIKSNINFRKVYGIPTPEFYTTSKVPIFKEIKYKTARDCLNAYNVDVVFV